ncbi:MAG: hypothetical protein LUG98_01275 [Tannerellaceae bacterium]|nr:hypothetical protein [Tannerellaceae bacterium]
MKKWIIGCCFFWMCVVKMQGWQQERMQPCYSLDECIFSEHVEVLHESVSILFREMKKAENRVLYTFDVKDEVWFDFVPDSWWTSGEVIRLDGQPVELLSLKTDESDPDNRMDRWGYHYYLEEMLTPGIHTLELEFTLSLCHYYDDWVSVFEVEYRFPETDLRSSLPSLKLHVDASAIREKMWLDVIEYTVEIDGVYAEEFEDIPDVFRISYSPEIRPVARGLILIQPFLLPLLAVGCAGYHLYRIRQYRRKNSRTWFPGIVYIGILLPFLLAVNFLFTDWFIRFCIGTYAAPSYWTGWGLPVLWAMTVTATMGYLVAIVLIDLFLKLYFGRKNSRH